MDARRRVVVDRQQHGCAPVGPPQPRVDVVCAVAADDGVCRRPGSAARARHRDEARLGGRSLPAAAGRTRSRLPCRRGALVGVLWRMAVARRRAGAAVSTRTARAAERDSAYRRFWARVGARFPDLGGAVSTAYYAANEQRLFAEHLPALDGL